MQLGERAPGQSAKLHLAVRASGEDEQIAWRDPEELADGLGDRHLSFRGDASRAHGFLSSFFRISLH
jgi:hypothetical protein